MTKRMIFLLLLWLVTLLLSARVSYADTMWTKLGRGATNLTMGMFEIPHQIIRLSEEERWPIALTGGIFKGIIMGLTRTFVGFVEMVTFPIPNGENYDPIMYPEFPIPKTPLTFIEWDEDKRQVIY